MAKTLFGKQIDPACAYCKRGSATADPQKILCPKRGIVSPCSSCRHFVYDPLRRVPKAPPAMKDFSKEDFDLSV